MAVWEIEGHVWWITDGAEMRSVLIMEALTGRTGHLRGATAQHAPIQWPEVHFCVNPPVVLLLSEPSIR